ncbi:Porin [Paraburkholderia sacchari]|uniref:porin n=1 Tax=Paraburkholderia sacchari TaxID=159450 RepID=UPI0039A66D87
MKLIFLTDRLVLVGCSMVLWGVLVNNVNAESSVTLYGVVDGGLLYTSKSLSAVTGKNGGAQWSFIDSGLSVSQFGLTGTETLGGGVTANFDLESGYSVASGGYNDSNGNMFGRQAWLSLRGAWGEVKTGLQYSPFFLTIYESDARGYSQFGSSLVVYATNALATGIFNANAISYSSPTIAGLRGSVMIAFGGEPGNFQAGRQYSASVDYQVGPLLLNAAVYDGNSGGTAATPIPTTLEFVGRTIGVTYKFDKLTAKASYVKYKVSGSFDDDVYSFGLDFLATPQVDLNGGIWVTSDRNRMENRSMIAAAGVQYFMSKATTMYAQFGVTNNHGAMDTGLSINGALHAPHGATFGADIGIRHSF